MKKDILQVMLENGTLVLGSIENGFQQNMGLKGENITKYHICIGADLNRSFKNPLFSFKIDMLVCLIPMTCAHVIFVSLTKEMQTIMVLVIRIANTNLCLVL